MAYFYYHKAKLRFLQIFLKLLEEINISVPIWLKDLSFTKSEKSNNIMFFNNQEEERKSS